jgi:hypothetical protein
LQYPPNQPTAITGNASVSAGSSQTYSVTAVAGATSYSWILPLGWTGSSTTNTINLTAGTNNGTVSVVAQNSCGTSPSRTLAVTISTCTIPNQPNAITGNASVSAGSSQTYSIASVANATSYNWALPLGWSGNSTNNTINITTGPNSGTISVVAQNSCGVSPSSSITVSVSSATNTPINHDWVWAKSTNEQYASNYSKDIATDADGNTYITGTFYSSTIKFGSIVLNKISPSSWDIFIAKYDANGNALWAKNARVDSPLEECAIATDANNNVFLTGSYKSTINFGSFTLTNGGSSTTSSMFLVKFDSQGNTIWAKDADYSSTLWVSDLAIDSQGNAFITGSYSSPAFTLGSTTLPMEILILF